MIRSGIGHVLRRLLQSACLVAFVPLTAAASTNVIETVGGVSIALPPPVGFSDPSSLAPHLRGLAESLTPSVNRLLAVFVEDRDLKLTVAGRPPDLMDRYFLVQTPRSIENRQVSTNDFAQLKAVMRSDTQRNLDRAVPKMQSQIDSTARGISKDAGVQFTMKLGEIKVLAVDDERPNAISISAATKYSRNVDGAIEDIPLVMSMSTVLVKRRVIFLYSYATYRGNTDLDWVRRQGRAFINRVLAGN